MIALGGPREAAHPAGAVGGEFPIFKIMYLAYLIPDTWYLMYNPLGYTRTMYLYFIIRIVSAATGRRTGSCSCSWISAHSSSGRYILNSANAMHISVYDQNLKPLHHTDLSYLAPTPVLATKSLGN